MATFPRAEQVALAPFIKPLVEMLDGMPQQPMSPDQLADRARGLLLGQFGVPGKDIEAAFAHGAAGLLSGHTHYVDGFALLMSFEQGTAVAIRETTNAQSVLFFEGSTERWVFDGMVTASEDEEQKWPAWAHMVKEIVRHVGRAGVQVDITVVSTVPAGCVEAYLSALGVATGRAVQALFAVPDSTAIILEKICHIVRASIGLPFSIAYLLAAEAGRPAYLTLVDTATGEQLPLDAPLRQHFGWGLIDVGDAPISKASVEWQLKEKAEKALSLLQKRGFEKLNSFRDLEHRDLQRALDTLPRRFKPMVRHLVSENRRVQHMVWATRKNDWQMFGALLLMSHASVRDDWGHATEEANLVVEQVEAMSLDGMYGASVSGRGSCVLIVGKPASLPRCLDRIKTSFEERFGRTPDVMVL